MEEKLADARRYQQEESIPWPVAIDDLAGSVHQTYGSLSDPSYLIGADGNVSFYLHWTNAPTLYEAIGELLALGGSGVVRGGVSRLPHVGAVFANGWKGLSRGTPQSVIDMETSIPGSALGLYLGHRLRPVVAPVFLKAHPLPKPLRQALFVGAGAMVGMLVVKRL